MKLLLYCTKAKPYIMKYNDGKYKEIASFYNKQDLATCDLLNGKIVAECDFDVEEIEMLGDETNIYYGVEREACLTTEQIENYLGYDNDYKGYAINIKNLHIFDKPYELGKALIYNFNTQYIVEKAPQNMMKVYNRAGECHILISIKPEWLCKILNGEKIIEVRKKVLKEMK